MIDCVEVTAFKSLVNVSLSLGRVNVFIGANGSGKSNLLEAIGLLSAAVDGRVDENSLRLRGVRPGVAALYKSSFHRFKMRNAIGLKASSGSLSYGAELRNPLSRQVWTYKNESLKQGTAKLVGRSPASRKYVDPERSEVALESARFDPDSQESKFLRRLAGYRIYSPNTNTLRGLVPDAVQAEPVGLSGGNLAEGIRRFKRQSLWSQIEDSLLDLIDWAQFIGTRSRSESLPIAPTVPSTERVLIFQDRFMAEKRDILTGFDASEGALYVLFSTLLTLAPEAPSFLAVDNVDHALNPRLARALMSWICERCPKDRQLILTTHNPLVLDGLPLEQDDVRLFAVGRSRAGHTTVKPVKLCESDLRRAGEVWTVSRLWVTGALGGVPDV